MGISGYAAAATAVAALYGAASSSDQQRKQQHAAEQAAVDARQSEPQAAKAPDIASIQTMLAGKGQGGGAGGVAGTFLTGAAGVDPGTFSLGRTQTLGGPPT